MRAMDETGETGNPLRCFFRGLDTTKLQRSQILIWPCHQESWNSVEEPGMQQLSTTGPENHWVSEWNYKKIIQFQLYSWISWALLSPHGKSMEILHVENLSSLSTSLLTQYESSSTTRGILSTLNSMELPSRPSRYSRFGRDGGRTAASCTVGKSVERPEVVAIMKLFSKWYKCCGYY